jgi:cell wall-associated NlpC family hydrolase
VGSLLSTFKTVAGQDPGSFPTTPTTTPATPGAIPGYTVKTIPAPANGMPTIGGPKAALDIFNRVGAKAALIQFKGLNQPTVKVIPSTTVATGGVSPNAPAVVAEIKKYLGTKYVWGGTTPKGFDCSGLLQYVWAQKGVHIPRTTYEQVKAGVEVPLKNLQPGDAVFFGDHNAPHHVGMYIGHGQFIDAPHTGAVVRIENLNDRLGSFAQARRFG